MIIQLATRLVAATALLLLAAHLFAQDVVKLLMPLLSSALSLVADDFEIVSFDLMVERNSASLGALALLKRSLFLGGQVVVPDGTQVMMAGATVGSVLQPMLVALVLVLAWPARWKEVALRVPITAALLLLVVLADTPFSLAAWLWDAQLRLYEPGRASPLVWWSTFLNGGGRLALGLVAGVLAIAAAQRVVRAPPSA